MANKPSMPLLTSQLQTNSKSSINNHSKYLKCILHTFDILVWPLTSCMHLSCWSKRRYFQHDLAVQCCGIFQTLIGILWASAFVISVEELEHKEQTDIILISSYCLFTYTLCNIVVIIMQRTDLIGQRISFFVGILCHIVAFGIKNLADEILIYFSSSFIMAFTYLLICLFVSIICIYGLSVLRKHFCFAVKETTEFGQKVINQVGNVTAQLSESFSDIIKNKKQENIYESDLMELFLNEKDNQSEIIDTIGCKFKKEQEFNRLIKNIDTGAFTIAVGFIFAKLIGFVVYYIFKIDSNEKDLFKLSIAKVIIVAVILIIFVIFVNIITYLQMKRDRVAYKMFESMKNRRICLNSKDLNDENKTDLLLKIVSNTENVLIGCCIKFSYKFYKLTEHIIQFITGCLGWSFGFALVSGIDIRNTILYKFYYSLIVTIFGFIFLSIRSHRQRKKLLSWRKETLNKINDLNAKTDKNKTDKIAIDEENIFVENRMNKNVDNEIDIFNAKAIYHQKLYQISHLNFFFRKAYGLMVALPWKITIGMWLDSSFKNESVELVVRFIIAIFATIIFGYTGLKFIEIEQESRCHSTSYATNSFLKGNYMQLKRFSAV
eukprot:364428_1